jgi:hypothetical protein
VTTFHVLRDHDGRAQILLRLRTDDDGLHGEAFEPGTGWVRSAAAFDVWTNGQDYDVIDADEADRLAAGMAPDA